jgi:hypothetical protein
MISRLQTKVGAALGPLPGLRYEKFLAKEFYRTKGSIYYQRNEVPRSAVHVGSLVFPGIHHQERTE